MLNEYKDILTVDDLCKILQCGKNTVYKMVQDNIFPSRKIGKKYLIPKKAIIQYINSIAYSSNAQ